MNDRHHLLEADRRTILKLLGAGALVSSVSTGVASAVTLGSEVEGTLDSVDGANNDLYVFGIQIDAQNASISAPNTSLQFSDLTGASFPGRNEAGFLGGTATAVGTTEDTGGVVTADSVFVEISEDVIVGAVTKNTIPDGGTLDDGDFHVQGIEIANPHDDRMPFNAYAEGTDMEVDIGTIPEGSLAEVEGYFGNDNILYAHTLVAEGGETTGSESTSISRAQCDPDGDPAELEVRGESSTQDGTIDVYDHETNVHLGTTDVVAGDGSLGEFRLRAEVEECPMYVRAENSNGSEAVAEVDM